MSEQQDNAKGTVRRRQRKRGIETRDSILDAAEATFANEGLNASMRRIMAVAGVNVASIHYHFGTREDLLNAVLERRAESITQARLVMLDEALAKPEIQLEDLVMALYLPYFDPSRTSDPGWMNYVKVRNKLIGEQHSGVSDQVRRHFNTQHSRFVDAFRQVFPDMAEKDVLWRYHCMLSISTQSSAMPYRIIQISKGLCNPRDFDELINYVIPLVVHMWRAPYQPVSAE
ncbi:TetR/AcrR family transcriptional regulator [Pokkaliibacter sp. CJK22405]|uniref:TetR/AcrR family transcriptional regulator n=1 Tax=Pokkaliibacter sp. CJK22405 TaxID=3384615 RepID=UPI003985093A